MLFHLVFFTVKLNSLFIYMPNANPRLGLTYLSFRVPKQTTDFSTSPLLSSLLLSVAMARLWVRNMEDHHRLNRGECLYYSEDDDEWAEGRIQKRIGSGCVRGNRRWRQQRGRGERRWKEPVGEVQKMRKVCERNLWMWRLKRTVQPTSAETLGDKTQLVVLSPLLTLADKVPLSTAFSSVECNCVSAPT